ncbi:MAG: DUF1566 domain-containing protein [Nautiliaceae bacterium]
MKKVFFVLLLVSALFAQDRFIRDDINGTVIDTKTNLMWQDNSDNNTSGLVSEGLTNALKYCENLTLAGYSDWRLPNYNELESLVDRSRLNPAISPIFKYVDTLSYYWTSTMYDDSDAWFVRFNNGKGATGTASFEGAYVRCVRDNK